MRQTHRPGYSLLEIIVVVGIMGMLISLLLPAVQNVRSVAARSGCANNLRQIGLGLHGFHGTHGRLPPLPAKKGPVNDPNVCLSWMALILPQIEQEALSRISAAACAKDPNSLHNPPHVGFGIVIPIYVCPADSRLHEPLTDASGFRAAYTSYIGIGGAFRKGESVALPGALGYPPGISFSQITDGLSQTIMVGERPPPASLQAGWWYSGSFGGPNSQGPNNAITLAGGKLDFNDPCQITKGTFGPGTLDNPCDRFHLWSLHQRGANCLFADGSIRFFNYAAEPLMVPLATRNGREAIDFSSL